MKGLLTILVFAAIVAGCTNSNKEGNLTKELAFKKFVARQKLVDLPIHFDLDKISDTLTQPLIEDDSDTLFVHKDFESGRVWGIYRDTSKYYIFINLYTAAVYIPAITVFDKNGNRIQDEALLVDGCGADCGYYCNAIADIYMKNSNIQFYTRDSIVSYTCDSLGKETPGTREHYVKFKSGFIDSNGRISKKEGKKDYENGDVKNPLNNSNIVETTSQAIKEIFDSFVQYSESTDTDENKERMKESFLQLEKSCKPEDLVILVNVWMYYNPTDFPTRKLIEPIFLKNKQAAIEAINKRIKNKKTWESADGAPYSELSYLLEKLK